MINMINIAFENSQSSDEVVPSMCECVVCAVYFCFFVENNIVYFLLIGEPSSLSRILLQH